MTDEVGHTRLIEGRNEGGFNEIGQENPPC